MNCRVCGNPLFPGRAIFRCSCGALSHSYCWDRHILESHTPVYTIGTVTIDGEFIPRTSELKHGSRHQEQEIELAALKGGK
jgi:hypothetical protein